jgi:hypothetical protein
MAEGAAEKNGALPGEVRYRLRAMSAATDNVGLFFGEDIFVAFGAIIFMHNFMLESAFRPSRCILPCGDPNGGLRLPDPPPACGASTAISSASWTRLTPGRRKAVPHEFSANLAVLAGGRCSAGGGGDVMAIR